MHWPGHERRTETTGYNGMPMIRLVRLASFAVAIIFPVAHAATVTGVASVNGTAQVTNTTIQFFNDSNDANTLSAAGSGNTGSYSTLNGLPDTATGPVAVQELTGGPFSGTLPGPGLPDYATFDITNPPAGSTTIDFDLTTIQPGVGTAAACFSDTSGNECTPLIDTTAAGDPWVTTCPAGHTCVVSPFTLVQVSGGVNVFFVEDGVAYFAPPGPPAGPGASPTVADLSTQGVFNTYAGIVEIDNALHSGNDTVTASVSGTFGSQGIPEPSTAVLVLGGLLIGIGVSRKKKKFHS